MELEKLSTIRVNCKNLCKIFEIKTQTDFLYCILSFLKNFQKDIFVQKVLFYMNLNYNFFNTYLTHCRCIINGTLIGKV